MTAPDRGGDSEEGRVLPDMSRKLRGIRLAVAQALQGMN
jgi:hypothetical protein